MKIYSSREFNQRTNQAQKAAHAAPVLITNRGRPDLVLLSHAEYLRLTGRAQSMLDVLAALPDTADIELEIPPRSTAQHRAAPRSAALWSWINVFAGHQHH